MYNDLISGKSLFDFKVAVSAGDRILLYWQQGIASGSTCTVLANV